MGIAPHVNAPTPYPLSIHLAYHTWLLRQRTRGKQGTESLHGIYVWARASRGEKCPPPVFQTSGACGWISIAVSCFFFSSRENDDDDDDEDDDDDDVDDRPVRRGAGNLFQMVHKTG